MDIYLLSSLALLRVGWGSVNDNIPHMSSEFTISWLDLALKYNPFCHSLRRKKLRIGSFFRDIKLDPGKLCKIRSRKSCFHQAVMNCPFLIRSYFWLPSMISVGHWTFYYSTILLFLITQTRYLIMQLYYSRDTIILNQFLIVYLYFKLKPSSS